MSCAQINVVGGGNGNPGPTIRMPGGISPTHPGLHINIYWPIVSSCSRYRGMRINTNHLNSQQAIRSLVPESGEVRSPAYGFGGYGYE